jgi:hypothetical protein
VLGFVPAHLRQVMCRACAHREARVMRARPDEAAAATCREDVAGDRPALLELRRDGVRGDPAGRGLRPRASQQAWLRPDGRALVMDGERLMNTAGRAPPPVVRRSMRATLSWSTARLLALYPETDEAGFASFLGWPGYGRRTFQDTPAAATAPLTISSGYTSCCWAETRKRHSAVWSSMIVSGPGLNAEPQVSPELSASGMNPIRKVMTKVAAATMATR